MFYISTVYLDTYYFSSVHNQVHFIHKCLPISGEISLQVSECNNDIQHCRFLCHMKFYQEGWGTYHVHVVASYNEPYRVKLLEMTPRVPENIKFHILTWALGDGVMRRHLMFLVRQFHIAHIMH